MNSVKASLGKNFVLLAILSASVLNYFYHWFSSKELLALQGLAGMLYIFLSCYEYLNASYKASLPVKRYAYFTYGFFMFRALKAGLFLTFAALLYVAESRIRYIYPICLIIATTEAALTWLKYRNNLCFVNIYANYLLIVKNELTRVFASEIMLVEFRHDIFYFVKKNRKTVNIRLEHIREKEDFLKSINGWISRNNVLVTDESKVKMQALID
jgi:hypothetical protein